MRSTPILRCLSVGSLLLAASPAFCQSGLIQGFASDKTDAVIANVKITATDQSKGIVVRQVTSGADGSFQLRPLLQGVYTLRLECAGFKALELTGIVLDAGQTMNLGAAKMEVGETATSVTIRDEIPLVETTTGQKGFIITSEQISELSLNGRDFGSLLLTLPGVTTSAQSDFRLSFSATTGFNVNGGRDSQNNVMLDGTHNTDVGDNGAQYTQPSLDAIGEFKVATSGFAAEFGRIAGVAISASTKAGGKKYNGALYYFGRNDVMDARPPFDITGRKTKLRFHQFGGNAGGPVYIPGISTKSDKKLFFFFNHETTRGIRPNGGQFVDIPRPELLDGDFSLLIRAGNITTAPSFRNGTIFVPGSIKRNAGGNITDGLPFPNNIIPKSQFSRNAAAFLKVLNKPDRSFSTQTPNAPEQMRVPLRDLYRLRKNQDIARIDYHINRQTNLFFRWSNDAQHEEQGLGIFTTTPYVVYPMMREKPGSNWSWNLVKLFGQATINEFVFAYTHQTQIVDAAPGNDPANYDRDKLGFTYKQIFPDANLRNRFPRFNCGVGSCNLGGFASTWENDGKDYAWTDNLTLMRGKHTFKVGVYLNLDDKQQQPSWNDAGNFDFTSSTTRINPFDTNNGLANLLTGYYTAFSQTNGKFYADFRFWGLEFYGQDSWKVRRNLTLELGARFAYLGPTYTRHKYLQNYWDPALFNPAKAVTIDTSSGLLRGSIVPGSGDPFNGIVQENSPGIPAGFGTHRWNQISPRVGFAWSPIAKTSVRGGVGTFFERIRQNVNNFDGAGNPPLVYTPSLFSGNVDALGPELIAGGTRFPVAISTFNREMKTPTVYSWNLSVQRQFRKTIVVEVAYVGNTAKHLQYRRDLNQLPLGTTTSTNILAANNSVTDAVRPYKGFTSINYTDFGATSKYNALQTRVSRRFSKRLTMNVNYTWAKALDDVDFDTTVIDYYLDRHRQWGPAGFDRKHVLGVDYVFYAPRLARGYLNQRVMRTALNGWQLSGISRFWTGTPLTISSNGNAGTLAGGVRADYLGGNPYPEEQSRNEFFNPLVFGRPFDGSLGNTGKGILRGPKVVNLDMSLFKNFRFAESRNVQFRLESFNVMNHTQWYGVSTGVNGSNPGQPVTAGSRGTSGQVTTTRDPRNIQLSLKLYW
ncbi:MAG: carboxypeptidase regulatory-like domain-containing protein [Candidatus Solibacter usitatus]|nr:carboxypeptidase regulatory-like domain-containing protein [Candidatus Solibacter usitatus]